MENYFKFYTGYQKPEKKKTFNFVIVCGVFLLSIVTLILGVVAIGIGLGKGYSLNTIASDYSIVFSMTIVSILVAIVSVIVLVLTKKSYKEALEWKPMRFYLDTHEAILLDVKLTDKMYIKGTSLLEVSKESIRVVLEDYIRLEFDSFYILLDKIDYKENIEAWLGGDSLE